MRLTVKIGVTMIGVLLFALVVTTLLNFYKYQSTLSELMRSRFEVVVGDIRGVLEQNVALGLRLSDITAIQELLDRARGSDSQIVSIEVFALAGESGRLLFSSGSGAVMAADGLIPTAWTEESETATPFWTVPEDAAFVVGATVLNTLDRPTGGVVLRYSKNVLDQKVSAMFERLALSGAGVLAIIGTLAFLGVVVFFRPLSKSVERMIASAHLLYDRGEPPVTEANALSQEELAYAHFHAKAKRVIESVLDADEDLHQMERDVLKTGAINASDPGGKDDKA
ncbi:MAG: hypothetical protein ACPGNT_09110 [Rhodospirillales bacterium]